MPCSRVVFTQEHIATIVHRLGREITSAFREIDNPLALVLLDGAKHFADDLLKQVELPLDVESLKASSYIGTRSSGTITFNGSAGLADKIRGRHILMIDDIYDTGLTLTALMKWLRACEPASIQTCVLLEKQHTHTREVNVDFIGTPVEDAFLIGYGLDYNGRYRDLPYIGVLSEELIR